MIRKRDRCLERHGRFVDHQDRKIDDLTATGLESAFLRLDAGAAAEIVCWHQLLCRRSVQIDVFGHVIVEEIRRLLPYLRNAMRDGFESLGKGGVQIEAGERLLEEDLVMTERHRRQRFRM